MKLTLNDIIELNEKAGKHFFDFDWIRYFGTKFESEVFDNLCFVTSEQDNNGHVFDNEKHYVWNGKRRYTIRQFDKETADVNTVGEFGQYETLEKAIEAIKSMA